jgi:TolB-like protein/class 3 adenylate cyclase
MRKAEGAVMAAPRVDRRLAAIMAVDVVGYSRLVGADEADTLARVKAHRVELAEPLIAEYRGRVVKLTGDGALVEFGSAVDAVECAVAIQNGMAEREAAESENRRIRFRIGINVGDIVHEDDDILGDGVNVAARLEGLAEPGGICIARNVHDQVKAKLDLTFEPMGEHRVKNIAEPITVYRVLPGPARARPAATAWPLRGRRRAIAASIAVLLGAGAAGSWYGLWRPASEPVVAEAAANLPLPLPDKPSLAVLPFENLSGDPKEERLAGGLTEDVITDLSRYRELFVIARNSTDAYRGKQVDVRQIARELGVQYVLEGSLQTDGKRVRITAQLIDAMTGNHVWSERYDRALDDLFAVQDEVTQQIAGTLGGYEGRLAQASRERARRKPPESLQAYDLYLLGVEEKHRFTKEGDIRARQLLGEAIALDPGLARAYVALCWVHLDDVMLGWSDNPGRSLGEFATAAKKAVALDDADAEAHVALGFAHFYYDNKIEQGAAEIERALALGSNNADVLANIAWGRATKLGTGKEDVELVRRAMRLNPHFPEWYLYALGYAGYHGQQYLDVIQALKQVANPTLETHLYLALSLAEVGRHAEASASGAELLRENPDFSAERQIANDVFVDQAAITHFIGSIEKAGLPLCATEAQLVKYPDMKHLEQCDARRASG